ncbi:MAG TPA: saccharopine dehydrogenase NADP-binding domain-containing protein, partial [Dongiaceae bacterium]
MTCLSRILIIGGYGRFGGQVAKLLADRADTTLLIAGRSLEKAAVFCADLKVAAQLVPMAFDREGDLLGQISAAAPDLIIDASGPFQIYGRDPYRVVKAALTCSICYIDLADGADFVAGITAFDDEAKARGIFILSGVSSYPALTAAAVDELARDMVRIDGIWTGIAPSPRAGFGLNVVRAIASYAGKPIKIRHKGEIKVAHAL